MGPKMQLTYWLKRSRGEERTKRRSKARFDYDSHHVSVRPFSPSHSPSFGASLVRRSMTMGRKIDFRFLEKEGFMIGQRIKQPS